MGLEGGYSEFSRAVPEYLSVRPARWWCSCRAERRSFEGLPFLGRRMGRSKSLEGSGTKGVSSGTSPSSQGSERTVVAVAFGLVVGGRGGAGIDGGRGWTCGSDWIGLSEGGGRWTGGGG